MPQKTMLPEQCFANTRTKTGLHVAPNYHFQCDKYHEDVLRKLTVQKVIVCQVGKLLGNNRTDRQVVAMGETIIVYTLSPLTAYPVVHYLFYEQQLYYR